MSTVAKASKRQDKTKQKEKSKDTGKGKGKALSNVYIDDSDSDEQTESQSTTRLVPAGSVLLENVMDSGEFDYDALEGNDDLELCVVRVPDGIKPKYLSNAEISLTSPTAPSSVVGTLTRKTTTYNIWSVCDNASDQNTIAGGDEVLGLSCLVPRKRKNGKLFPAPKPIVHHLVLTAQPVLPTPPPSSPGAPDAVSYKSPARYQYPKHLLKHRFLPTGTIHESLKPTEGIESMDVDQDQPDQTSQKADVVKITSPKKKRRVDGESKKTKKAKMGS
ncbi:hypothetical protein M0805_006602 [Coniferiporia weirii]|nr:hypothetical protein M0805_006602 [Coniferiporia weirii]